MEEPRDEGGADGGTESVAEIEPEQPRWKYDEVLIPAGSFLMGSPLTEPAREENETQHKVTLTRSFYMGKYEVTQREFEGLMGYHLSRLPPCADCPTESALWHEAASFANQASQAAGLPMCFSCTGLEKSTICRVGMEYRGKNYYDCRGYRLPTEAEWEYAYRAGTNTSYYNGDLDASLRSCFYFPQVLEIAWYCWNSLNDKVDGIPDAIPRPVGLKVPNAWGLYDMAGNVEEWVFDEYEAYPNQEVIDPIGAYRENGIPNDYAHRVVRGGSIASLPRFVRAAYRYGVSPMTNHGFRLVRSSR
jgi:formylglycine-generating enzyme required for sulfatase activity